MARIGELLARGTTLSFEFAVPRGEEDGKRLWRTARRLERFRPSFVSVTYGAAGSTREGTRDVILRLRDESAHTPMPHLTCIAHSRAELAELICDYRDHGIENLLALHGDPPLDNPEIEEGDFRYAIDLVQLVRELAGFSVGVATHPEGHPKATDHASDREHQAAKLRVADFGITQFFFDAQHYWRLVEDMAALGVQTPIIPGVIPVTNVAQVQRFADLAGATFPPDLLRRLEAAGSRDEVRRLGVEHATALCSELLEGGAPGLHLYTLNFSQAALEILRGLGIEGGAPEGASPLASRGA